MYLLSYALLQLAHGRCQVAPTDIDIDPTGQTPVLAAQHWRPFGQTNLGDGAQGDLLAGWGEDRHTPQCLRAVAPLPGVAQADREAGQSFNRLANIAAADGARYHRLHIGDAQAIARRGQAVDLDVHVAPAGEAFRQRRTHPRHLFGHSLDIARYALDVDQGGSGHFHPNGALDPRRQHVDAVADGRHPDIGQPRNFYRAIQFLDQLFGCHPRAPLIAWFELHRGFEHFQRCWIGGGLCSPGLAEHPCHFGHREDHPVGLLQQLGGLAGRQAGQG